MKYASIIVIIFTLVIIGIPILIFFRGMELKNMTPEEFENRMCDSYRFSTVQNIPVICFKRLGIQQPQQILVNPVK